MPKKESPKLNMDLISRIHEAGPETPQQEVKPVKGPKLDKSNQYHLNAFIPKDLATEVKIKAMREGKTLTDIVIEQLQIYLNK